MSLASYFGVRYVVLHGAIEYHAISGVDPMHILDNVRDKSWPEVVLLTVFGGVFFLLLYWRQTPLSLKRLYFYLLPVLLVSSVLFSWIRETRNYMPLVIILSVIAARYCMAGAAASGEVRGQNIAH